MATEAIHVSVSLTQAGSSLTFHFPGRGEKTVRLPFEALGDGAEAVRQSAFRIIEQYGRRMAGVSFDRPTETFSGVVLLTDEEVREVTDVADMLAKAVSAFA